MTTKQRQNQARRALEKRLDRIFSKSEQDELEWFCDSENDREYIWKFMNPADGQITEMVYGFVSKTVTVCGTATVECWENAWNEYISRLKRLEELKSAGRYGYQLRMPYKALNNAILRLRKLDPDFCKRNGI
ncbi:hypothetical protein [Paenibacillus lutrae]|uniref:Uncharacterized protein n=1 Tax=Paenibacillus lutrae TaxID=2078573 RepID=A0A7X3FM55_9BACL|nr:hypothetical protein [Paenibacillus lutrae]MVP02148.1 hypothetical protein [Paenibacillus lutrae]